LGWSRPFAGGGLLGGGLLLGRGLLGGGSLGGRRALGGDGLAAGRQQLGGPLRQHVVEAGAPSGRRHCLPLRGGHPAPALAGAHARPLLGRATRRRARGGRGHTPWGGPRPALSCPPRRYTFGCEKIRTASSSVIVSSRSSFSTLRKSRPFCTYGP